MGRGSKCTTPFLYIESATKSHRCKSEQHALPKSISEIKNFAKKTTSVHKPCNTSRCSILDLKNYGKTFPTAVHYFILVVHVLETSQIKMLWQKNGLRGKKIVTSAYISVHTQVPVLVGFHVSGNTLNHL